MASMHRSAGRSTERSDAVVMRGIVKRFPGVTANDHVDFTAREGEIHALVGENGAGKSTLMHILSGLYQPDSGSICVRGQERRFRSAWEATRVGIGIVHQNFMLVPSFSVLDNLILGAEPTGPAGLLRRREARQRACKYAGDYGFTLDPDAAVGLLPIAMQQQVEILKCLLHEARIMIFDEPTAVLTPQESAALFAAMRDLASRGRTIIMISHKLQEVLDLADRITVLRDGRVTGTVDAASTSELELARLMVGRDIHLPTRSSDSVTAHTRATASPPPVLEVEGVTFRRGAGQAGGKALGPVTFSVDPGEIVGIAAIAGNGQQELVEVLAGLRRAESGSIRLAGTEATHAGPGERRQRGLAYIPQDKRGRGTAPGRSVLQNVIACHYRTDRLQRRGWLRMGPAGELAHEIVDRFDVRGAGIHSAAGSLSGGNLQKLVVGRELSTRPRLLIAEDPTQGVDIGSVESIRRHLLEWAQQGCAILLVSQDLSEVLALSDRVLVMYEGSIVGERSARPASQEDIGLLMAGGMRR